MRVFRPWAFQGSFKRRNYFEGWYFKHVSADRKHVWSFIPGVSLNSKNSHAFIQALNGRTGASYIFEYGVNAFSASSRELDIQLGTSGFNASGIKLDLQNREISIQGSMDYTDMETYPSSLRNPGIMGWYSFVPFMECKHGIVSMHHSLKGGIQMGQTYLDFDGGTGYIEKDWGSSFPESWVWLHCNTFNSSRSSFTFSVAKIPWLGSYFIGFISYLRYDGGFINFSTWSRARIEKLTYRDNLLQVQISNAKYVIDINAINNQTGQLKAPELGSMTRMIKETVDATIELKLKDHKDNILFQDRGTRAGMEIIEKILEYFN
jgi:hypothetical protein